MPPKDIATNAVLNTKIEGLIAQIAKLESRFDIFQASFVRDDVYNIKHQELVKQVAMNTSEIRHIQKNEGRNVSWVWPIATFVLGGLVLFLIEYAFTHH